MKSIAAISFLIATCTIASAQKPDSIGEKDPCYQLIIPPAGGAAVVSIAPVNSILLNRCTGATWILHRQGQASKDSWSYRWSPISINTGEATFGGKP